MVGDKANAKDKKNVIKIDLTRYPYPQSTTWEVPKSSGRAAQSRLCSLPSMP